MKNEAAVLDFISKYRIEHGRSPSYREICAGTGIKSVNTICRMIDRLQVAGKVRTRPGKYRSIELIGGGA
jgi:repressor LexA